MGFKKHNKAFENDGVKRRAISQLSRYVPKINKETIDEF